MTKNLDQQLLIKARKEYKLTPGRVLDTAVLITGDVVDVQLTQDAASVAADLVEQAYPKWNRLYQSKELSEQERLVVERHMGEISLVAAAVEQVLMDQDNSDEIDSIEGELYDYYSPELFRQAVSSKIDVISEYDVPQEYESRRVALIEKLSVYALPAGGGEKYAPGEQVLQQVGEWIKENFGDLLQEIDDDPREEFDGNAVAEYFCKAIGSKPVLHGWKDSVVETEKSAMTTMFYTKEFVIPRRMKRKKDALKRTVVHEMGHALRSAIAEQNGMEIGQFGTATYARFEESFMMAIEQCLVGEYDPKRGLNHYLATGLSVTEKMPKEDIADILNEANFLSVINKKTPEAAQAEANRLTGIMINRTFVGMTDVDDGIAHRKDIDYYHGLADSWKLLNFAVEHDIVEETMNWVLSAKFNPFNADDRAYVNQYVTMPRELEQLFAK